MGAYAATVTLDMPRAEQISKSLKVLCGEVDVTNYNSTLVELTGITGKFTKVLCVIVGISDAGYKFAWNSASSSLKAFKFNYAQGTTPVDGPAIEAGDDADVGAAKFIAFGV